MSEGTTAAGNGSSNGSDTHQFALQALYVKDLSFESPNSPAIFAGKLGESDIDLNIQSRYATLGDDNHEVVLNVTAHARADDRTLFLVEVQQAGIFTIRGYDDAERKRLLGSYCPQTLFPFAREAVSSAVSRGGFPPVVLQPVNFDALYARSLEESAA